jgi:hypothetical protein
MAGSQLKGVDMSARVLKIPEMGMWMYAALAVVLVNVLAVALLARVSAHDDGAVRDSAMRDSA